MASSCVTLEAKKRIYQTYVLSVLLFGCESWSEHTAGKVSRQGGGEGEGKRGEAEEGGGGRDDPFTGSP